ncbi:MAG: site-2 protease family protein [Dehalococcoidales bacterium]
MKATFRLGKILGIQIGVHYSWLFIFILITWSLAATYYPANYPDFSTSTNWILGALSGLMLFVSVLAHELGHSIVAQRRGIPVKSITLFIFGGAASITKEADTPGAEFSMAITGPATSFLLAGIFWLIYIIVSDASQVIGAVAFYLATINAVLGVFNLVPGFPLDGGRVFRSILWAVTKDFRRATRIATGTGQGFAYFLIVGGIGVAFLFGFLGGLWLALIGWFLSNAASASYRQTVITELLREGRVKDIMTTDFKSVPPDISLQQALHDYLMQYNQRALPVVRGQKLEGLLTMTDIKRKPREQWPSVQVSEVMTGAGELKTVGPEDGLNNVIQLMESGDLNQLPVISDQKLVGLISRSDLIRYLKFQQEIGASDKIRLKG